MKSERWSYVLGIIAAWVGVGLSAPNVKSVYVLGFLIALDVFITYICIIGLIHTGKATPVRRYSGPTFTVTAGPLAEKYMIIINFQGATCIPYQEQIRDNRTCIYFGNGRLSISNSDPTDVVFEFNDNEDQTLAVRIADLNKLIEFTPNIFGTWEK
jgi:hypothetical protein